jgi:hypothetical protein
VDVDLFDVSPVTYQAYEGTVVGLRSAEAVYQEHLNSLEQQGPPDEDEGQRSRQAPIIARARLEMTKRKQGQKGHENG